MMAHGRSRHCFIKDVVCVAALAMLALSQAVCGGFVDVDTPADKRTTVSFIDGTTYDLVMSDEFNVPNRTFADGHDPIWTALDKPDDDASAAGGGSLQFYNSTQVTTKDGMMHITTTSGKTEWSRYDKVTQSLKPEGMQFKSGMVQSWEKFCFTGGIVEVDVVLPGDPDIGGLWPAIWMMGNLGRATYEGSTNNLWPWSFNTCDRDLQKAQKISACNAQNHFGMKPHQGRGATEIDILEVMAGNSYGQSLPSTIPPVSLPYADMTLQVAPGIPNHRPSNGAQPVRHNTYTQSGTELWSAQSWYEGLEMQANTSINPFFYGTYLGETEPGEPVTRSKDEVFQADAVGAMHQMTRSHFEHPHTFRLEWQPGEGGRLDWFTQTHKVNATLSRVGDGDGKDWTKVFTLKDSSLRDLMGSQIPIEPSYLIMNVAVSSTWGFPYSVPDSCKNCYDCDDPKCACRIPPGFCAMLQDTDVKLSVDSVRVYQSRNDDAHVGAPHTLGCDPPDYPTKEWIEGHSSLYMRNDPFSLEDNGPIRKVQRGGGICVHNSDCGSNIQNPATASSSSSSSVQTGLHTQPQRQTSLSGRGRCVSYDDFEGMFSRNSQTMNNKKEGHHFHGPSNKDVFVCQCNEGYTGPHCLALDHVDNSPSAQENKDVETLFQDIPDFAPPIGLAVPVLVFALGLVIILIYSMGSKRRGDEYGIAVHGDIKAYEYDGPQRSTFEPDLTSNGLVVTGRSI